VLIPFLCALIPSVVALEAVEQRSLQEMTR
jgi:hypothetical protein